MDMCAVYQPPDILAGCTGIGKVLAGQPAMHKAGCHHEGKAEACLYFGIRPVMP